MKDIWPVGEHAFAIADSPSLGVKILEWNDADARWTYIDDGSQNASLLGELVGKIWAPDENEVYYAVAPGYIYHGTKPIPPATAWTWTKQQLKDNGHGQVEPLKGYLYDSIFKDTWYEGVPDRYPAAGVWGTSRDDVYAWFTNTIYHWTSAGGGSGRWVAEYVANDSEGPDEDLFFLGATGLSPDGIWFSGARARGYTSCPLLFRRTSAGYQKVADGNPSDFPSPCTERAGLLSIPGGDDVITTSNGWLTDIQATSTTEIIGLKGTRHVVRIADVHGSYSVSVSSVPSTSPRALLSLWVGPKSLWLSEWGLVYESSGDVWSDGTYNISSISLNGAPLDRAIYQVRGTSNTNLWAIGVRNALHKTTP